jgi:hypothetical protein
MMPARASVLAILSLLGVACVSGDDPRCGDGERGAQEECDGADVPVQCHPGAGAITCNSGCALDLTACSAYCGDGVVNGEEGCDGLDVPVACHPGAGAVVCNADCTLDVSACSAYCGDGVVNGDEECDGPNMLQCPWWCTGSITCTAGCRRVYACVPQPGTSTCF